MCNVLQDVKLVQVQPFALPVKEDINYLLPVQQIKLVKNVKKDYAKNVMQIKHNVKHAMQDTDSSKIQIININVNHVLIIALNVILINISAHNAIKDPIRIIHII